MKKAIVLIVALVATIFIFAPYVFGATTIKVKAYNPAAMRAVGYLEKEIRQIVSGEVSKEEIDDGKRLKLLVWKEEKITAWLDEKYRPVVKLRNNYGQGHKESRYDAIIISAANAYRVRPSLIKAVISIESGFNSCAVSPKGATGLMQLMPYTAIEMGVMNPCDPEQNIYGGTRYLAEQIKRFNGNMGQALAAYNAGPEAVKRVRGIPKIPETQTYVYRVMAKERIYASR